MGYYKAMNSKYKETITTQPDGFVCFVQAWSQFAGRLEDLAQPEKLDSALSCLNLLVTDALRHVPDVIAYLSRLRNQSVFNFCAIPQVK